VKPSSVRPTDPEEVNTILLRRCAAFFPLQPCLPQPRPGQSPEVRCTVSSMWVAYRQFKSAKTWNPALTRLQNTWAILRAHARFQRAHRELRKRGLAKRKAAILEELEAAEAAAKVGDMHKLYFHVRKHFTAVFCRDAAHPQTACCLTEPCPLSLEELLRALQMQRGGRAIPPGSAPPELWKHLASMHRPSP